MKLFLSICILFASFNLLGANSLELISKKIPTPPQIEDTLYFDLSNSTVTQASGFSYLDIPVFIKTTINPFSFDFWFKFNESKMTYNSTISLFPELDTYSNFDANSHYLQNTTSGPSISYQVPNNTTLIILRFLITDPCVAIEPSDFYQMTSLMDGVVCNHKVLFSNSFSPSNTSNTSSYCSNTSVDFTFPSSIYGKNILTWNWDFANGVYASAQNPSTSFTDPGTYPITINITTEGGCAYTFVENADVFNKPTANFSYIVDPVQDSVFFLNIIPLSSIDTLSFVWNFGDSQTSILQDPAHRYVSGGNYVVSLVSTSNHGCADTHIQNIIIDKPTANYTYTGSCSGSLISFLDNSVYSAGTISSWHWDFGDGTSSTQQNPTHVYTFSGSYTVTLIATSSTGSYGTFSSIVVISSKPLVQFLGDALSGCTPLLVNFNDLSIAENGSTYLWNFGDNSTSNSNNPSHTYLVGGVFPVKLIVTTLNGCSDSLTKASYINVISAATANFTSTDGCKNSVINFIDNSTISAGNIIGWNWNFGDGSTSTTQNPNHIYPITGTYTVTLIAVNELGCTGSISKNIIINDKPTIQFTSTDLSGCTPLSSNFQNLSSFATGSEFIWNFGDGSVSSTQNPNHLFTIDGNFDISLIVIAPGGCKDSLTLDAYIHVFDAVHSDFSTSNRCANSPTIFNDISTITNGTITSWNWNFGNGSSSILQNPSYVYTVPGSYNAILTVQTNQGCSNSFTKLITIDSKPLVNFSVNDSLGCSELLVQFMDQTATVNGSTYNWDFGDNSTSQLLNPSNLYTTNGSYTIKEIVTSPEGCTDSIIKSNLISMQSQPSTTISASNYAMVLPKSIIDFKSQSQNYTELLWNFGDFNFSSLENPSHDFLDTGKFTVCLSVFSSFGCKDTACLEVKISASNAIAVPSAFTPNGDGNNDEFLIKGGPFLEIEMKIMNEWGNLLFTSSSQNIGWNGKYDNTDQAIGLYEYIITGKTLNNEDINLYGVLNLTR